MEAVPDDGGIRDGAQLSSTLSAESIVPRLVETTTTDNTHATISLDTLYEVADAVAAVEIVSSSVESTIADPTSIKTRFVVGLKEGFKGAFPNSFTLPGGADGAHTLRAVHVTAVHVGSSYLAFFRAAQEHILFVTKITNRTVTIGGEVHNLANIANDGAEMSP